MKKLILPIFFVSIITLLFNFLTPSPIFAFFGDKPQSDGEFDCLSTVSEVVNPASAWKSTGATAEKRTLKREENDYCLLKHQSHVSDYGYSIGGVEDPVITWTVRITYLKDKSSFDEAFKYLDTLKKSEKASFKTATDSISGYSGQTSDLSGPNYFKDNSFQGRCLIQHAVESNLAPVINSIYKWSLSDVQGLMSMMGEWAKGLTYDLSGNQNLTNFCNGKDFIPANLIPSDGSESSSRDNKQTGLSIDPVQAINDWIMENDLISDPARLEQMEREKRDLELYGRTPEMTAEIIRKYEEEWQEMFEKVDAGKSESPYRLDILNGQVQIKLPGQNEWSDIKQGDKIPPGSTLFTGMDTTTVLSVRDKGVIQILSFTEVTITEEGLADPTKTTTKIDLRAGEIELNVKGPTFGPSFQISTPNSTTGVRGTHFWVSYDKNKKLSTVGVYKGEVEVKTRGSDKSIMVSPTIDKPGVVLVSQKLSTSKFAITGLVLAAIIAALFVVFKKRRAPSTSSKRRK